MSPILWKTAAFIVSIDCLKIERKFTGGTGLAATHYLKNQAIASKARLLQPARHNIFIQFIKQV
jgi:hypothetical protein